MCEGSSSFGAASPAFESLCLGAFVPSELFRCSFALCGHAFALCGAACSTRCMQATHRCRLAGPLVANIRGCRALARPFAVRISVPQSETPPPLSESRPPLSQSTLRRPKPTRDRVRTAISLSESLPRASEPHRTVSERAPSYQPRLCPAHWPPSRGAQAIGDRTDAVSATVVSSQGARRAHFDTPSINSQGTHALGGFGGPHGFCGNSAVVTIDNPVLCEGMTGVIALRAIDRGLLVSSLLR